MKLRTIAVAFLAALTLQTTMAKTRTVRLVVVETTDIHGVFFPFNFIENKPMKGSVARIATFVDSLRQQHGKNVILLDNGDILQGQPTCYYSNYIKTNEMNIAAKVINKLGYDAETVGNHDIEPGHKVYDKWRSEVRCPMLGANVVNVKTGEPYFKPYTIIERDGLRIAVMGLLTNAVPNWLNESLWQGLRFDDMKKTAEHWMAYIKKNEKPDLVIGLFHSGWEGGIQNDSIHENDAQRVAREVPGFDLVMYGHDHTVHQETITNADGRSVVCINPANNARNVGVAHVEITIDEVELNGKLAHRILAKQVTGENVDVTHLPVSQDYENYFKADIDSVRNFVNRRIGYFETPLLSRDCFFGSAAFTDFIHDVQLKQTGADISFNAPLTFNAKIDKGDVYVRDLFKLYRYENSIYMLRMTGEEIKNYLEMSYAIWTNTMRSADDHIMLINDEGRFLNPTFNFDSAAGIDYEVDVTKPQGQKVRILRMSNGKPFDMKANYKVSMSSYRGNGGGELLTKGAGLSKDEIQKRILSESEKDQRYYLMQEIEQQGTLAPKAHGNWRFVPEAWAEPAIARDKALLFGE